MMPIDKLKKPPRSSKEFPSLSKDFMQSVLVKEVSFLGDMLKGTIVPLLNASSQSDPNITVSQVFRAAHQNHLLELMMPIGVGRSQNVLGGSDGLFLAQ